MSKFHGELILKVTASVVVDAEDEGHAARKLKEVYVDLSDHDGVEFLRWDSDAQSCALFEGDE